MMYGKGKEDKKGMGMMKGGMAAKGKKMGMNAGGVSTKKTKGRPDAQTTRNMQQNTNRRMTDALRMSAGSSAGIREGMDYGRFPGTAGDRLQTERENTRSRKRVVAGQNERQAKNQKAGASNAATQKRTPKK